MKGIRLLSLLIICCSAFAFTGSSSADKPHGNFRNLTDTLVVPFEYKQSAIVHQYTLDALDSVCRILRSNKEITLSIEGYSYVDEGNDTVCKYLSLNRALFVRECLLGRGIDTARITSLKGMGQWKPEKRGHYKVNQLYRTRVDLLIIYPVPPPPVVIADRDEDGIPDAEDTCPDVYGYSEKKGCPYENSLIVPFVYNQSYIGSQGFEVLDNLLVKLRENRSYTITINGHAAKTEGTKIVTDRLSKERMEIVAQYLASRQFSASRIDASVSYGKSRPVNAQRNPREIADNQSVEIVINKH